MRRMLDVDIDREKKKREANQKKVGRIMILRGVKIVPPLLGRWLNKVHGKLRIIFYYDVNN